MIDIAAAAKTAVSIADDLRERAGGSEKTRARDQREMACALDAFAEHLRRDGVRDGRVSAAARQALDRATLYFQTDNPTAAAQDVRRVGELARTFAN